MKPPTTLQQVAERLRKADDWDDVSALIADLGRAFAPSPEVPVDAECTADVADADGDLGPCGKPSRFIVGRSDADTSFGAGGGTEEACESHLVDAVDGMIGGDEDVTAVVTIRWDRGEESEQGRTVTPEEHTDTIEDAANELAQALASTGTTDPRTVYLGLGRALASIKDAAARLGQRQEFTDDLEIAGRYQEALDRLGAVSDLFGEIANGWI